MVYYFIWFSTPQNRISSENDTHIERELSIKFNFTCVCDERMPTGNIVFVDRKLAQLKIKELDPERE